MENTKTILFSKALVKIIKDTTDIGCTQKAFKAHLNSVGHTTKH